MHLPSVTHSGFLYKTPSMVKPISERKGLEGMCVRQGKRELGDTPSPVLLGIEKVAGKCSIRWWPGFMGDRIRWAASGCCCSAQAGLVDAVGWARARGGCRVCSLLCCAEFSRRWCTLQDGVLSYYENDRNTAPNGEIRVEEIVCLVNNPPHAHG